jgi:hypothetical protein
LRGKGLSPTLTTECFEVNGQGTIFHEVTPCPFALWGSALYFVGRWRKSERLVGANSNTSSGFDSHLCKAGTSDLIHLVVCFG